MTKITANGLELGQMWFGNPVGEYECPESVEAMVAYLFEEMGRIYWNDNQKEWDRNENPKFKGIKYRPYYWGEDKKLASKPNFQYKEVELRWYKHFGRSMTLNVKKTSQEWVEWFEDCLKHIREHEKKFT